MVIIRAIMGAVVGMAMPPALAAGDLKVEIRGALSTEGTVYVALFDEPGRFPVKPLTGVRISVKATPLLVTFADVKPGNYAISAFDDVNGNGVLDKNLLGLPTEKYGFSRDAARLMGPPSFDEAAITVGSDDKAIVITLR
jgi:uncharacterized protein (DUF2141 family)